MPFLPKASSLDNDEGEPTTDPWPHAWAFTTCGDDMYCEHDEPISYFIVQMNDDLYDASLSFGIGTNLVLHVWYEIGSTYPAWLPYYPEAVDTYIKLETQDLYQQDGAGYFWALTEAQVCKAIEYAESPQTVRFLQVTDLPKENLPSVPIELSSVELAPEAQVFPVPPESFAPWVSITCRRSR